MSNPYASGFVQQLPLSSVDSSIVPEYALQPLMLSTGEIITLASGELISEYTLINV